MAKCDFNDACNLETWGEDGKCILHCKKSEYHDDSYKV
jgi:hypothetical protein